MTVLLVDEIFALYLYRMSNRINQFYYKIVLAYVIFFRECLNEYGWGKKIESEGIRLENNPELVDVWMTEKKTFRSREHFLGLLYEYFIRTRAATEAMTAETAALAYAFHNLPSMLNAPDWTPELSASAWRTVSGAAKALGGIRSLPPLLHSCSVA